MSHEAPFETAGAPDGELRYPHSNPTISEAWQGYERQESEIAETEESRWSAGASKAATYSERLMKATQAQLTKLRSQVEENPQVRDSATQWQTMQQWLNEIDMESEFNTMRETINTEEVKRWSALMGGGFLALFGLRRSLGSLTIMGFGLGLAYYALSGRSPLAQLNLFTKKNGKSFGESGTLSQGSSLDSVRPLTVKSVIVKAPLHEVYQAWADFENFPRFMQHIKSVTKSGDSTSHWMMEGPFHTRLEWDAEMTRDEENKRIAWSSTRGDIKTSGQVTFNALPDEQVEVTVMLKYVPPAGLAGDIFARLFSDPEGKLDEDLRNFKRYIETASKASNGNKANQKKQTKDTTTNAPTPQGVGSSE